MWRILAKNNGAKELDGSRCKRSVQTIADKTLSWTVTSRNALAVAGILVSVVACSQSPEYGSDQAATEPALPRAASDGGVDSTVFASTTVEQSDEHADGEDWGRFLGPRTDGTSWETPLAPQRWDPHPPLLYSIDLGVSYGGPAVTGRRLYQFCRYEDQERLTCYDVVDGTPLWSQQQPVVYDDMYGYNNGPRCSPVVDGDLVFTYGVAGRLTCYRESDGKIIWTRDMTKEYGVVPNFFGVASSPYVYRDLLLVMVGGSPPESQDVPAGRLDLVKPNGSAIVALDKRTGKEVYRTGNDLASYSAVTVRQVGDQLMGLAFLRGGLLAWDPDSGRELFAFPWRASKLESVNAALPVTYGNKILLSETYEIGSVLLSIENNQPKIEWKDSGPLRKHAFRAHWATPVAIQGYLYGCSGRNQPDADFRCIRLRDGELQWAERTHERSSVLLVDGYLIVLGELGHLDLVRPNPEQLDIIASADLNEIVDPRDHRPLLSAPCWAPPVLSHGRLFLRGRNKLICLSLIQHPRVSPPDSPAAE